MTAAALRDRPAAIPGLDWLAVVEDGGEMLVVTLIVVLPLRANLTGGSRALAAPASPPRDQ